MFSKKKRTGPEIIAPLIDEKVGAIIRYAHLYSGFFYGRLANEFADFKDVTDDYSMAFMELFTVAAIGVSLHSPSLLESGAYLSVISSAQSQLDNYFEHSHNKLSEILIDYIQFEKKHTNELISMGYNFSEIPAYWLLHNLNTYKDFFKNQILMSMLGNELTNHFIHVLEDTWKPKELDPTTLLN